MEVNGVEVEETFAEAFPIKVSRILITAATKYWAKVAAQEATGFGTSVIMCPAEAGIERFANWNETPDGRPGYYIQICNFSYKDLEDQVLKRLGQCVLTAPTTAVFNGLLEAKKQFDTGYKLKFFGDGMESETQILDRKMYSIPIMEGDFLIEESIGAVEGVAGGNFFIFGDSQMSALNAAQSAVEAINKVEGTITPFPGGIVASGSKPGANKYTFLKATANEKYCPSIKDKVEGSMIPKDVNAVYEIVINGLDTDVVSEAIETGVKAAVTLPGIKKISAGNYGGNLGPHQFYLKEILK
ncbi:formylmethanofuran/tetrahydromethanopterin N-formyltransferase [Methanohalobium evestigatum Z-7303]|uniref:Formylmethanofuran--tetrahydromethanopterin formyltransferase n=1 Tax=Methanohalobium evestigatum (strain ATCC BAA-1072 / DSM 3721 / NBRC 107634 / OCM 161 / Z-7303) TaxID=644295 RepID=D7EBE7_METEZ|nr:formylmethanofuran--tetrahydromethanopterin N-formyltransferase [Methanohalobium evestigatum]ADI74664.1 formylmethanofuran/tetrahydromethanopterin N-formyltransferase [Methanohalobium evestigatum Z-7303]